MRYVAKIHVMDVMDQVVVSGYVFDADPLTSPDHEAHEFTFQAPGRGLDDPIAWLIWHVYEALQKETTTARGGRNGGGRMGGSHTLSGTTDVLHD